MSIDQYSTTPANNDLVNYFKTGMRPSAVKNAGWDVMADIASYLVSMPTAGGTANALTVSNARPFGSLAAGLLQLMVPSAANTGSATFAPDGLATAPIHAWGKSLLGGEMQAGVPVTLQYDGTNWNLKDPGISPLGLLSGALEATIFTANGNFTPKATGNYLVIGIGGGGGGGSGGASSSTPSGGVGGSGGAGGGIGFSIVSLTAGTAYPVVIGTGGGGGNAPAAGTGTMNAGSAGNPTTFNSVFVGAGGLGGQGGSGTFSSTISTSGTSGSVGGGLGGGQGGAAGTANTGGSGVANTGGGGGGGGGANSNGPTARAGSAGGAGGSGILIVIRA